MNPGSELIRVRGLRKRFGEFVAVDGVDLSVREGEVFGFIGSNGAGKTTTIRMLSGVLEPSGGEGSVAGHDLRSEPEAIKEDIGYMSQTFSLYGDLTVEENIEFYSGIYRIPRSRRPARKRWVLELARLEDRTGTRAEQLPRGMKQRLALGCALLHEPRVVFLDEPTSGVDPRTRRTFWERIRELSDGGTTVFVTTHYMDEAEYCDRLGLIHQGRILADGTPRELRERPSRFCHLRVRCDEPQRALEHLGAMETVVEAELRDNRLRVTVEDGSSVVARLRRALREAGVDVREVARDTATLEDVFLELIARSNEAGPQS